MNKNNKYTKHDVEKILMEKGFILIGDYIDTQTKITIKDKDDYKYYTTYNTIMGNNKSIDKFNKGNLYTIENIHNYIKLNNIPVKLLSTKFINSNSKLLWECDCGNTFERIHSNVLFNQQCKCKSCENKHKGETRIFSTEFMKLKIEEKGYKFINDDDYIKNKKVNIKDKEGYMYNVIFANIAKEHPPIRFGEVNPYSLDNIRNFIKIKNINSKLISNEYKGQHELLTFTCKTCGQPYDTTPSRFIFNNKQQCNNCGQEIKNKKHRHSYEYVKNITEEKGYILLSSSYRHQHELLDIMDKEGYKYKADFCQIKQSGKLLRFYETNPYTIDNINNYIKQNKLEVKLLSKEYLGSNELMLWECSCGEYFESSWERVLSQHQVRCKKCSKVQSIIENKTEIWLKNNNYIYKTQVCFDDCKDIKPMPFDFGIYDNNEELIYLIECDGRQHFEKVRWSKLMTDEQVEECFILRKYHDKLKDEYCEKQNINLIRLPYWEFKNNNYIKTLQKELN
jgi:hypothetical protein